jgi:hypothetical protein
MNTTKQNVTKKTIDLPAEVKRNLSIRAINADTNLKNYIEMICFQVSESGVFCDDNAKLLEASNTEDAQTKLTDVKKKALEQYLETFRK